MSIKLAAFLEQLEAICATKPDYRSGGSGTDGTCDCIGLIIGAVRRAGGGWNGIHGSNYAARKQMTDFAEIKSADLFVVRSSTKSENRETAATICRTATRRMAVICWTTIM